MTPDFDPWSLLKNAWILIAGVFVWIFKRHLGEDDLREERQRQDVQRLHEKIDANHRQLIELLTRRD